MHTYIVTYRQPDGKVVEERIKARDHLEAQRRLQEAGMDYVVVIDRETRADRVVNRRVRGVVWSIIIALPIAAFAIWRFMKFVSKWAD